MKQAKPLDDLEMFELIRHCYPDKFKCYEEDSNEQWEAVFDWIEEEVSGWYDWRDIASLLGKVLMTTPTITTALSGRKVHAFTAPGTATALALRPALEE